MEKVQEQFQRYGQPVLKAIFNTTTLLYILLATVIIIAAAARIIGSYRGLPYLQVHDEPQTANTALNMMLTGDYNPYFFSYGSLLIYINLVTDIIHYLYLMAQPWHATDFLRSLEQIQIGPEEYPWTTSHPSFYLWNRWVISAMGTASLLLVFQITRTVANRWAGLAAAALLGSVLFHVDHSTMITNDVPVSFCVLAVIALAIAYVRNAHPGYLLSALIVSGLAASFKYNSVLIVAVPFLALVGTMFTKSSGYRHWLWIALFFVPPLAFLAGTPYAYLDLPTFLSGAGWEVFHYRVLGHGAFSIDPGIPHLQHQLNRLYINLGFLNSAITVIAILGLLYLVTKRLGWLILSFGVIYSLYMSTMIVSFHRNFLSLYTILAIGFGCGIYLLWRTLGWAINRVTPTKPHLRQFWLGIFAIMIAMIMGYRLWLTVEYGQQIGNFWETRTAAVHLVNQLFTERNLDGDSRIGVAEELRVHTQDIRKLFDTPTVEPQLMLLCNIANYDFVIAGATFWAEATDTTMYKKAQLLNLHFPDNNDLSPAERLNSRGDVLLGSWPVISPDILIYSLTSEDKARLAEATPLEDCPAVEE